MPTFIKAGFWEQTCKTCKGYNGWLNLDQFAGVAGTNGTSGLTGTSGLSGDRYRTTITGSFTLGTTTSFTIGTGLAYTPAQDIIISYDESNHEVGTVVSYNPGTGAMVIGPPITVVGSGTYSGMTVNLNGAAGGNGSSGTSGSSGINGTSGSSGIAGTAGISGTSGTSYAPPLPVVYGLYTQTANSTTVTGTVAESTLIGSGVGSLTVAANQFQIGDSFRADFGGVLSTGNNQTIRVRVKAGSVILADSGVQTISNVSNDVWSFSINFTIRTIGSAGVASIVSLGKFHYTKTVNGVVEGFSFNTINNSTFNTTISNVLDCTVEFGSTSGTNSIYSDVFVLNKIY